jgi:hypothetical protein
MGSKAIGSIRQLYKGNQPELQGEANTLSKICILRKREILLEGITGIIWSSLTVAGGWFPYGLKRTCWVRDELPVFQKRPVILH